MIEIQTRPVTKESGQFIAYYAMEDFYPFEKEFFLGVSIPCNHMPGMSHVSFNQYRNELEMPDITCSDNSLAIIFQFYADSIWKVADEFRESSEWESQEKDNNRKDMIMKKKKQPCPAKKQTCSACNGSGKKIERGSWGVSWEQCRVCNGSGER